MDYSLLIAGLGCLILGVTSGALGCFAVLERRGLMGDALAHCTLPGVVGAYLLFGQKNPMILMLGAAVSAIMGAFFIQTMTDRARVDQGSAMAVTLSSFFGLGILGLSWVQKNPDSGKAGLERLLFGQAASMTVDQVWSMALIGGLGLICLFLTFKEMQLMAFDPGFAEATGVPMARLTMIKTGCLVAAIVIGINTVGVILMSAMLVAPAVAARRWTNSLGRMIWIAAFFGSVSGLMGAALSFKIPSAPTGPSIVLALALVAIASIAFGPQLKRRPI